MKTRIQVGTQVMRGIPVKTRIQVGTLHLAEPAMVKFLISVCPAQIIGHLVNDRGRLIDVLHP